MKDFLKKRFFWGSCLLLLVIGGNVRAQKVGEDTGVFLPRGPYLNSCDSCFIGKDRRVIECQCEDRTGNKRQARMINPDACDGNITNCDGILVCGPCRR